MFEFSVSGSRIKEIREPVIKDGKWSVEVTGKEDLQDYIESFSDSCDLENIIKRAIAGDEDALNQRIGTYGDFTVFPKTYAEALEKMANAQNFFSTLKPEIRAAFNNDIFEFISELDKPDFAEKIGIVKPSDDEVKEGIAE